jgi:hypothetical protein
MSEQTKAKNIDNISVIIAVATELSAKYSTTNELIKLNSFIAFRDGCQQRQKGVNDVLPVEDTAIGERSALFNAVPKKATRILNAVKSSGITEQAVGNLRTTMNSLRGFKVSGKTPDTSLPLPEGQTPKKTASASQRSFASVLENTDLFVEQVKAQTGFKPNEAEFKTAALEAWVADLTDKNNAAISAKALVQSVKAERDEFMYNSVDGLQVRVNAFKAYLRSILDKNDIRLKQISKLRFSYN